MAGIGLVEGQFLGLLVDRICHLAAPIADIHAVEAGECVYELLARAIADDAARPALHDARRPETALAELFQRSEGMKDGVPVRILERMFGKSRAGHSWSLLSRGIRQAFSRVEPIQSA